MADPSRLSKQRCLATTIPLFGGDPPPSLFYQRRRQCCQARGRRPGMPDAAAFDYRTFPKSRPQRAWSGLAVGFLIYKCPALKHTRAHRLPNIPRPSARRRRSLRADFARRPLRAQRFLYDPIETYCAPLVPLAPPPPPKAEEAIAGVRGRGDGHSRSQSLLLIGRDYGGWAGVVSEAGLWVGRMS